MSWLSNRHRTDRGFTAWSDLLGDADGSGRFRLTPDDLFWFHIAAWQCAEADRLRQRAGWQSAEKGRIQSDTTGLHG